MRKSEGFRFANVVKDRPDLRDLVYAPSLRGLQRRVVPPPKLLERMEEDRFLLEKLVRNQLDSAEEDARSSCTAQALSSVIDILRLAGGSAIGNDPALLRVSADMLYDEGRAIEAAEFGKSEPSGGLRSLRSAIKAFYHNGVCTEDRWLKSRGNDRNNEKRDDIAIAKSARDIPLGAYYRLRPILNDYHAALNDVGAIYAAAEIHAGWSFEAVKREGRIDVALANSGQTGCHAFVIVGYDEAGFLVLNSWGPEWGGYADLTSSTEDSRIDGRETRLPGVAHWSYRDWAERIVDGWVLRLGVPTPNAFEYSFGEHGIGAFLSGAIRAGSTPRHELMGHYIHLDDGAFAATGAFPSDARSIKTTVDLLNSRVEGGKKDAPPAEEGEHLYLKVLLWVAGGSEGTKDVIAGAVTTKDYWKSKGVYPITVLWCSDFIESSINVLGRIFDAAFERVGTVGDSLDKQIEIDARGIGRAFWRDIKNAARRSVENLNERQLRRPKMSRRGMHAAFDQLFHLDPRIELHIIAEGAGAFLVAALIEVLAADKVEQSRNAVLSRIETLTLLAPGCTMQVLEETLLQWQNVAKKPILLLVPDEEAEKRMTTGVYQGSVLQLVQRSFEEERQKDYKRLPKKAVRVLGISHAARATEELGVAVKIHWLSGPVTKGPIKRLRAVTFSEAALDRIAAQVVGRKTKAGKPRKGHEVGRGRRGERAPSAFAKRA